MKTLYKYGIWVFVLLGILSGQSCGTYYYVGTKQTVLKYKEKGDLSLELGMTDLEPKVKHVGIGYAFAKHWAYNTSYSKFEWNKEHDYIWDNEIIFFYELEKNLFASINVGGTFGKLNSGGEYFNLDIYREFIQPSVGFSNDFVDIGVSLRFTNLHYNLNKVKPYVPISNASFDDVFSLYDVGKQNFTFIEPALTLGLGYKWVKLRFQLTRTVQQNPGRISAYTEMQGYFSINTRLNVNDLLHKKKKVNSAP